MIVMGRAKTQQTLFQEISSPHNFIQAIVGLDFHIKKQNKAKIQNGFVKTIIALL